MSDDGDHELSPDDKRILKHVADKAREGMPTRRDALKYGAVGFAAAGFGSGATGTVMADGHNDSDGQVGTEANPVDVMSDYTQANTVSTDDATIKDRLAKFHVRKSGGGTFYANAQQSGITSSSFGTLDGALQHALDEINGNGGRIEVSDSVLGSEMGQVDISGKADSLTIEFSGYVANPNKITLADSVDGPMFLWDGATAGTREFGFTLIGLVAEGNKANNTSAAHGFQVVNEDQTSSNEGLRDVFLDRVFFDKFAGDGVRTRDCWGWRLSESVFLERCDGNGLFVEGTGTNLKAIGAKIRHNNNFDIRIGRPQCSFIGCEFGGASGGNQPDHAIATASNCDDLDIIGCNVNAAVNEELDLNTANTRIMGGSVNTAIDAIGSTDLSVTQCDYGSILAGTRTRVDGEYVSGPTFDLGGTDGQISPTDTGPDKYYTLRVQSTGSSAILTGINNLDDEGTIVRIVKFGSNNVTIGHNDEAGTGFFTYDAADATMNEPGEVWVGRYDPNTKGDGRYVKIGGV